MTTNQTQIVHISSSIIGPLPDMETAISAFITSGTANGFINFEVGAPVVTPEFAGAPGLPTGAYAYTVQINYYDPSLF